MKGHNLGALHDGSSIDCPINDNFIMVPEASPNSNLTNLFYFSKCSIKQWKALLLTDNG